MTDVNFQKDFFSQRNYRIFLQEYSFNIHKKKKNIQPIIEPLRLSKSVGNYGINRNDFIFYKLN